MPYVLDAVYLALLVVLSPWLAYRSWTTGRYRDGWPEKFLGRAPRRISGKPCVWFHAVSVGEVLLLRPLVSDLARRRPGWDVVISTTTSTGLAVARRTFPDLITFYAPLDFTWATRRALSRIRPTVLALVELELWPNLVRTAKRTGVQVAIINGRLSRRSHRGYRALRGPLRPTLRRLDAVAVQSDEYAARFADLGVPESRIRVTGSVKYDGLETNRDNPRTRALRRELFIDPTAVVFVAGSTMEGEDEAAYEAYRAARASHPSLRLILVPRHPERCERLAAWLESRGERVLRRSRPESVGQQSGAPPIALIDTVGELSAVWGLADVAFVGGSLFPGRGGQNMMEPAAYGAAVLFGANTSNFREAVEGLLSREGAKVVADTLGLRAALEEDLDDPEAAATRAAAGRAFVLAQHGASARTLAELDRLVLPSTAGAAA